MVSSGEVIIMYDKGKVLKSTLKYFNKDELASNVWMSKYALKDKKLKFREENPNDMHKRMTKEFARIERMHGGEGQLKSKEIMDCIKDFKYLCPQGSPMFGIGNNFQSVSLSNCVVIDSPKDNMSSILEAGKEMANLYKRRAGVGVDISDLRPDGASVNNAAKTSSGAWSFADFYSYITRMVGQSGRRGALLISMDIRHPDIEKFIMMKDDKTKVTGANVSVKIRDDFMQAVKNDTDYSLQWPVESKNPSIVNKVRARDIWDLIVKQACDNAEPGLLFWDTILKNLPSECYADDGFKTLTVNPCGEINLSAYSSCILISQNLKSYVKNRFTDKAAFNFKLLAKHARVAQRLADDIVELELEKLNKIANESDVPDEINLFKKLIKSCSDGRRTGSGTHGLADALACLGLAYDSKEAAAVVEKIYSIRRDAAYESSIQLAKERGAFPVFNWKKEKNNDFIKRLPASIRKEMAKHGRRNISLLTNAPTGSLSILSQTSSGIEPVFRNSYRRRKKLNHNEPNSKADFVDAIGDRWKEFDVYHHNAKEWMDENKKKELPDYFVTSDTIDWEQRVDLQGIITSNIDHSVSNTVNLPKGTSYGTVSDIYMRAWETGCKGVTVYVDGSRTGVLVTGEEKSEEKFSYRDATKRPDDVACDIHQVTVKGEKWTIIVGLMDDNPYEVFGGLSEMIEIPKKYKTGRLVKAITSKNKSRYDLFFGEDGAIRDITTVFDNVLYQTHTRMVSLALRHQASPSFLVEQLQKDPDSDLTSFSRVLSRVLKKYIVDGTKVTSDKACPSCTSESMVYQEGCVTCQDCGWSKCG